jgi:hypothetical protein
MFGLNDNNQKVITNNNAAAMDSPGVMPGNPFSDGSSVVAPHPEPPAEPASLPSSPPELPPISTMHSTAASEPVSIPHPPADDALLELKEQALQSLQPLVSHLEQSPEEKFKTTMMLIQATDNSSLVKEAYEAANQISDEKARAQALLDVVNEINYFTQKDSK